MIRRTLLQAAAFAFISSAAMAVTTGAPAPAFMAVDSNGVTHKLSDYAGKTVVLEWTNHECPYVRKHYGGRAMQALQSDTTKNGIVWLTVISSAPGKQGYVTGAEANELTTSRGAAPSAVLLDPEGTLGHAYGARTTPHMYVITAKGTLAYQGAIDDRPTPAPESLNGATAYVRLALADVKAGKPIATGQTTPYGCSIKYKD